MVQLDAKMRSLMYSRYEMMYWRVFNKRQSIEIFARLNFVAVAVSMVPSREALRLIHKSKKQP